MGYTILEGDCLDVLPTLAAGSVGAIVTDPPYGIHFMGKQWDKFGSAIGVDHHTTRERSGSMHAGQYDYRQNAAFQHWCAQWGRECLRLLKPGGYLVSFGSPRTYHRLACGLEDAGFEVRDSWSWIFSQGFPKSLNLGDGVGTALKPAHEPIVLARKPLDGTYAANVARWGVGGLNIDACRVEATDGVPLFRNKGEAAVNAYGDGLHGSARTGEIDTQTGRWPTNLLLTHSPLCAAACHPSCPVAILDAQSGTLTSGAKLPEHLRTTSKTKNAYGERAAPPEYYPGSEGGASRFFPTFRFEDDDFVPWLYCGKAARSEREAGLGRLATATPGERTGRKDGSAGLDSPRAGAGRTNAGANIHPTVKPVRLMRWVVRLVCPPGETVLDPFGGSGTTGVAALAEGREVIIIEREAAYLPIIRQRLYMTQPGLAL